MPTEDMPAPAVTGEVDFRRVTDADFPLLRDWLAQPHVARWWHHETSIEAVRRDFGPAARGEEPCEDLLALVGGVPVGLVQRSRLADYPDELADFADAVEVPAGAMTVDYLIGDPDLVGHGLGPRIIRTVISRTWHEVPDTPAVLVAVAAANVASWRALEKAGLRRVGEGDMQPDNPVDDRLHYVYRVDRPA
jgi:aminoglycoside 6'-N-acetyltransferase